jgi:Bacterial Ig-like domain (group 1)
VKDAFANPTPGIHVRFTVTGAVNTTGNVVTNAAGQAQFCYTGPALPGADVITAFADTAVCCGCSSQSSPPGDNTAAVRKTLVLRVPGVNGN